MTPPACPSLDTLLAYLTDSQQGQGDKAVEQHLDHCQICLHRLETLYSPVTPPSREFHNAHTENPARHATTDSGEFFLNRLKSNFPRQLPTRIGPFQVLRLLAEGGTGDVFECRDTRLNRRVAIKTIRPQMLKHRVLERLNLEARIQGTLSHDNIVPLHDFGTNQDGIPYLVMEMIDGGTLSDLIRQRPLAPTTAARLIATCARAIHYAHEKGVLHRDLKPSNILLTNHRTGRQEKLGPSDSEPLIPKITDFGLAKLFDDDSRRITQSGSVLGTPTYMSPEQAAGGNRSLGKQSDVYALGVVLYECLTGRPPFLSDNVAITLRMIQENEPLSPQTIQPDIPKDLNTICLKCLEKSPERRYPTALELAEDLEAYIAKRPIHAQPITQLARAWRWCRRKPLIAASLAIAGLSLTCLTAGSIAFAIIQKNLRFDAELNRNYAADQNRIALANYRNLDVQNIEIRQILFNAIQNTITQLNLLNRTPKAELTPDLLLKINHLNQTKWLELAKDVSSKMENDFTEPDLLLQLACFITLTQDESTPAAELAHWQNHFKNLALNFPKSQKISNQLLELVYQATLSIAQPTIGTTNTEQLSFAKEIYHLYKLDRLNQTPSSPTLQLYLNLSKLADQQPPSPRSEN